MMSKRKWIITGALAGPVVGGALVCALTVVGQAYPVVGVIVGLAGTFSGIGAIAGYLAAEERKRKRKRRR